MQLRTVRRRSAALALAASLVLIGPAGAGTDTIIRTGQPAPGGGTFSLLSQQPALNNRGEAAFSAQVVGGPSAGYVYLASPAGLSTVAFTGEAAPNASGIPNGTIGTFREVTINDNSAVAFIADVSTGGQGLFRGTAGGPAVTYLARTGDAAPGFGGGSFGILSSLSFNAQGTAAFRATANLSSPSSQFGYFSSAGAGTVAPIARINQAAPGGGTFSSFAGEPSINDLGQTTFWAGNGSSDTVYRGNVRLVVAGMPTPVGGTFGGFVGNNFTPGSNNLGQVAFYASINDLFPIGGGIFRSDAGTALTPMALIGNAAPATFGTDGTFASLGDPALGDGGHVAFAANLTGNSGGANADRGVYRSDGINLLQVARKGDRAPDGAGTFVSIEVTPPLINKAGVVAFQGNTRADAGGSPSVAGIHLGDGRELLTAVRVGQALTTGPGAPTVASLPTLVGPDRNGRSPLNDHGQFTYFASLSDGSAGVFLYTPELHWRAPVTSAWDVADNWTLGLTPASVHPVHVDPRFGGFVSGPAVDTSVRSLTVGSRTVGTVAQLSLTGGSISSAGDVLIKDTGQLDSPAGAIAGARLINQGGLSVGTTGRATFATAENAGTISVSGPFTVGTLTSTGTIIAAGSSSALMVTGSLSSSGAFYLQNAAVAGAGTFINDAGGLMVGRGAIANPFVNQGTLNLDGTLTLSGASTNGGQVNVPLGTSLRPGGGMNNAGEIALTGGALGAGVVTNEPSGSIRGRGTVTSSLDINHGLIHANAAAGLTLASLAGNSITGQLRVNDAATLNVITPFTSQGQIVLDGDTATLAGGAIINTGTITGHGRVTSAVTNAGIVRPAAGKALVFASGLTTNAAGRTLIDPGAEVLAFATTTNAGLLNLVGGSYSNVNSALNNTGQISGYGTLSASSWTNNGSVTLIGGPSVVHGNFTNSALKSIEVRFDSLLFTGNVTNNGTIKNTEAHLTFAGNYGGSGSLVSDPADNYFMGDASIGAGGSMSGGAGDRFFMKANFANAGTFASSGHLEIGNAQSSGTLAQTGTLNVRAGGGLNSSGNTTIGGAQAWGAATHLDVTGGTTSLHSNAGSPTSAPLGVTVAGVAAQLRFSAPQYLNYLTVKEGRATATAGGGNVLRVDAVDVGNANAILDLSDNKLIVRGGDVGVFAGGVYSGLTGYIASAYDYSAWDGPGIATSMTDAGPTVGVTTLAISTADETFYAGGTFGGVSVNSGDVLVMYTYAGDVNLDGLVDASDYGIIDNYYQFPGTTGYANGDFNYDGIIDAGDYGIIDNAYQLQGAPIPVNAAPAGLSGATAVPEPSGVLLLLGSLAATARHRRQHFTR